MEGDRTWRLGGERKLANTPAFLYFIVSVMVKCGGHECIIESIMCNKPPQNLES